jgi:hypothetical protein
MSAESMHPGLRKLAVRNLLIDQLSVEIAGAFATEDIQSLVLKGPVLAEWLYPGELRPYEDSDLMVSPRDWDRAVGVLRNRGFSDYLGPMTHPRMESFASTAFLRGSDNVDLHCALHGLEGDMQVIWSSLSANAQGQAIGGTELRVPDRAALLLHVGLHAAHHAVGKTLEDLRRAIARADHALWLQAVALAREYDGLQAFSSGLRLLPEGVELADRLGIGEVRSVAHEIRYRNVPTAEALNALLVPGVGAGEILRMVFREAFPKPAFMRWWSPLARKGLLGLLASYPWRWIWLLANAPRGLLAVWRARRA